MVDSFLATVRGINRLFAGLACVLALVIVAMVVVSIALRALGAPLMWGEDVAQIAFLYLFFLALGPALKSGSHVTVELFDPVVPRKLRRYLGLVAAVAITAFSAIFVAQLWKLTGRSFATGRLATTVVPIPLQWLQIAGPIGVVQLLLTALAMAVSEARALVRGVPAGRGAEQ